MLENLNASVFPDAATTYTVLTSSVLGGAFANVANGARLTTIDGSGSFVVNYGPASAFNPNQVVLSNFIAAGPPGDFDHDGDVDGRDFLVWQRGGSPTPMSAGDLTIWRTNFGAPNGPVRAVPEPEVRALWLSGLAAAASRRRRRAGRRAGLRNRGDPLADLAATAAGAAQMRGLGRRGVPAADG